MQALSRDLGADTAYVYGLIRQESRFITDARSHVGAAGLMRPRTYSGSPARGTVTPTLGQSAVTDHDPQRPGPVPAAPGVVILTLNQS